MGTIESNGETEGGREKVVGWRERVRNRKRDRERDKVT